VLSALKSRRAAGLETPMTYESYRGRYSASG